MTRPKPFWLGPHPLVLASASPIRARLLLNLDLPILVAAAHIDERAIVALEPEDLAVTLACAKAVSVSPEWPDHLTLGADQTLIFEHGFMHKPKSRAEAEHQLRQLSAKSHKLISAVALVRNGQTLACFHDSATITVRHLSDVMIETYLDAMGDAIFSTVGGYQLEALGPHILEDVSGDHTTVLGLPLWPLLAALRDLGYLMK